MAGGSDIERPPAPDPAAQNLQTIAEIYAEAQHTISRPQRRVETMTAALGRPRTLAVLALFVLLWISTNLLLRQHGLRPFDPPPFFWLQGLISVSALLMAMMILITQNRQGRMAEQRDLLDLHVNLISEQKIAKVIALVEELRRDLPSVGDRHDPQAEAMAQPVDPHAVVATLGEKVEAALEQQVEQALARSVAEEELE